MFVFSRSFTSLNKKSGINKYLHSYSWCDRCSLRGRSYHSVFQQKVPKSLCGSSIIKFQFYPNALLWKRVSGFYLLHNRSFHFLFLSVRVLISK